MPSKPACLGFKARFGQACGGGEAGRTPCVSRAPILGSPGPALACDRLEFHALLP